MVARLSRNSGDRGSGAGHRSCGLDSCRDNPVTPRRLAGRMRTRQNANDGFIRETFPSPVTPPAPRPARSFSATQPAAIRPRLSSGASSTTIRSNLRCDGFRQPTRPIYKLFNRAASKFVFCDYAAADAVEQSNFRALRTFAHSCKVATRIAFGTRNKAVRRHAITLESGNNSISQPIIKWHHPDG